MKEKIGGKKDQRTKLWIKSHNTNFSLPKKIKDKIKKDVLELLNQGPIGDLDTEFLKKNEKNPREDFSIYKKDMDHEKTDDIFDIENKETNYLMGKVPVKKYLDIYYLVNIGELVDILGEKKIMTTNKNIQIQIALNF